MSGFIPPARMGVPRSRKPILLVIVVILALLLGGRLIWVQGLDAGGLAAEARKERTVAKVIPAVRGDILDRSGATLATTVQRYDVWVNQLQVGQYLTSDRSAKEKGIPAAAKALAPVLGMSVDETQKALTGKRGFVYLKKSVTPDVRSAITALGIPGVGADRVADRIYPAGSVAGNILGFMGDGGKALAGIEYSEDARLRGKDGRTTFERGAGGQQIPSAGQRTTPAVDGSSIELTINRDIQFEAQRQIQAAVKKAGAKGGSIVALDPKTGEVLALAEYPTYDPNRPGAAKPDDLRNGSISNVFEPGSTGKLFTFAAAIDSGKASLNDRFTVPYTQKFNGNLIKDSHEHPVQRLTLAGVLQNSSNVGTVQVAGKLTPATRYDYLRRFGLGQRTGIELPGESAGIVHPVKDWTGRTLYTTTFGQGYAVTALQVTSAVGTFANDGVHVKPTVVRGVRQADGSVRPIEPRPQNRVISSAANATMVQLMDNDVPDDGKQNADVANYAIAGKTGTAQVGDGTYTSSFIGFAPADRPSIVMGVFVYGVPSFIPGNTAAAPTFASMMEFSLQNQRIPPTGKPGTVLKTTW